MTNASLQIDSSSQAGSAGDGAFTMWIFAGRRISLRTCFEGSQSRCTSSLLLLLHDKDVTSWPPALAACSYILLAL